MPNGEWFKSSYSGQNGECLEARHTAHGLDVRDSKQPDGPLIPVGAGVWSAFLADVRDRHSES